jgi:RHS repeat-associated protein
MTTTVAPSLASNPSLAGSVARHEKAYSEFFFDSYSDFTTSNEQITKQTPDQSYVASTNCTSDFCCNQQYSVTAITTAAAAIAERYTYTAYGLPTILNASATIIASSAISNRYTYTGREWDATLALHHFRARWMSPIAGRFLGRDPIGYLSKSALLYEYCGGCPIAFLDPDGLIRTAINPSQLPDHLVDTGIKLCESDGWLITHTFIKTRSGRGFGYYAKSHLRAANCLDDVCTMGITSGAVVDTDAQAYPKAPCSRVIVDSDCYDPVCYAKAVEDQLDWWLGMNDQWMGYNVMFYNCHHWARQVIWGRLANSDILKQCKRNPPGPKCSEPSIIAGYPYF